MAWSSMVTAIIGFIIMKMSSLCGKNHVNGIESFWSFAKLRVAKMRGLRKARFLGHLLESQWRWNHRRDNLYKVLLKNLSLNSLG
jgi:transposase